MSRRGNSFSSKSESPEKNVPTFATTDRARYHSHAVSNNENDESVHHPPEQGLGLLSLSTPPFSRQRRHSKLNEREMSMDHGGESITFGTSHNHHRVVSSCTSVNSSSCKTSTATSSQPPSTKNSPAPPKERYRIVIMGCSAVGKTAIVEQFLYGSFPATHCATVEELHKGEYEVAGGGFIPLEILDTSGSFEFPAMRRLAISAGDAFALVYSIDAKETFEEIKNIREMIVQEKKTVPPIVVVGNKLDLEDNRQVQLELAECLCIDWEHGFVECSARNNKNIVNIFSCMLLQARLKGCLNVLQVSVTQSPSRHIGYKEHGDNIRRRRSSLPISELFHRRPTARFDLNSSSSTVTPIASEARSGHKIPFHKRNSCNPS